MKIGDEVWWFSFSRDEDDEEDPETKHITFKHGKIKEIDEKEFRLLVSSKISSWWLPKCIVYNNKQEALDALKLRIEEMGNE